MFLDFDDFSFADVQFNGAFADFGDFAEDPSGGDDFVVCGESGEHFAVLLGALVLRADEQEIKHHDDENQRQQVGDKRPAARAAEGGVLGKSNVWEKHDARKVGEVLGG